MSSYFVIVTSEDVCCSIRNVKLNIQCETLLIVMFVTAVCFLFLLKLKWPKNKNFIRHVLYSMHRFSGNFKVLLTRGEKGSFIFSVGRDAFRVDC